MEAVSPPTPCSYFLNIERNIVCAIITIDFRLLEWAKRVPRARHTRRLRGPNFFRFYKFVK